MDWFLPLSSGSSSLAPRPRAILGPLWSRTATGVAGFLLLLVFALAAPAPASADEGVEGPDGTGAAADPSGSKPESKLWFNDGFWWGSLWDVGTADFYIWKLDPATNAWIRTGTRLDTRMSSRADTLWDGKKLYVASHTFSESDGPGTALLYRFSYNTTANTYSQDAGFPATINSVRSETLVIAKDSTGELWATWEQGSRIWVTHTTSADTVWAAPFLLPGAAAVNADDISSIIAFGGNKIGIFWSNQSALPDADYFAIHRDADPDGTWSDRLRLFLPILCLSQSTVRFFYGGKNVGQISHLERIRLLMAHCGRWHW